MGKFGRALLIAAIIGVWLVIALALLAPGNRGAKRVHCIVNEKQLAAALLLYGEANNERFPESGKWMDSIEPLLKMPDALQCPALSEGFGYAFTESLGTKALKEVNNPQDKMMLFDSTNLSRNAQDDAASLPNPGRHDERNNVAFADGHAKSIRNPSTR
ncbi:MAG: hypothetical protein ACAH95_01460 [Fimbriimonas sp.]